jgi:ADP-sugar diphosphatase
LLAGGSPVNKGRGVWGGATPHKIEMVFLQEINGILQTNNKMATNSVQTSSIESTVETITVMVKGNPIPVIYKGQTNDIIKKIVESPKFKDYVSKLTASYIRYDKIELLGHYMFGPHVGFVWLDVHAFYISNGTRVPGVVFLRGPSVACLLLIKNKETGKLHMVLVKQYRIALPGEAFEGVAGMGDLEVHNLTGPIVNEIKQETGIAVSTTGVKTADPHQQFNYLETLGIMAPSPGGTYEPMTLTWYMQEMTTEEINALNGRNIENIEVNCSEKIQVLVRDFNFREAVKIRDPKVTMAVTELMLLYPGFVPM